MTSLRVPPDALRFQAMIGTGGIGSGSFFALSGDQTLGREESRGGRFLDRRDYCKLHIISHYVSTLLGPAFTVVPVGMVGDDDVGRRLFAEMEHAGLDMRCVERAPGDQTLFSFCFVYPDGSGGNMTTDDSACSRVDPSFVARAGQEFHRFQGRGIALAVPEVPLEARRALLKLGTDHGFFRVASFTSAEIPSAIESKLFGDVDLLALNRDEAAVAAGLAGAQSPPEEIARAACGRLVEWNPAIRLSLTAGRQGSWTWDGRKLNHVPSLNVPVESTAGAGDAHLSGIVAGLAAGLSLTEAQQLGTLVAAVSVTSPHTIHPGITRDVLRGVAIEYRATPGKRVRALLEE